MSDNIEEMFRLSKDIEQYGKDWADKVHAATLLEETKNVVRAEIANRLRHTNPHLTYRDSDVQALISDDYRNHLIAMAKAKREANIARVIFERIKTQFEATRTAEVSRRSELNQR